MTIDVASTILANRAKDFRPGWDPEERDAVKLGIEALKYIRESREKFPARAPVALPGETKE